MSESRPELSLLVAVHNRPSKLRRALQAIPPERRNIEVVIVDDASTDETASVIEQECARLRCRCLRHSQRRGAGPSRNSAAQEASADWCLIYDSDNELVPGGLDAVLEMIDEAGAGAGVMYVGSVLRSTGERTGRKVLPDGPADYRDLLAERIRGEYCVAVRTDALREFPYDDTPGRDTPAVTWRQIARKYDFAVFDRAVIVYDDEGDDRVSSREQSLRDPAQAAWCHRRMLEVFGDELRELAPTAYADHLSRAAFFSAMAGDRRQAIRDLREARAVRRPPSWWSAVLAVIGGRRLTRRAYARGPRSR